MFRHNGFIFSLLFLGFFYVQSLYAMEYPQPIVVTPTAVTSLKWNTDDNSFLYTESSKIVVRNIKNYNIIKTLNSLNGDFIGADFSQTYLAGQDKIYALSDKSVIFYWDYPYNEAKVVSGYNYADAVYGIGFSSNGNYIAFGDNTGSIHLLRQHQILQSEFTEKVIAASKSPIYSLDFSQNGNFLITASQSGSLQVWNVNTYKEILSVSFYAKRRQAVIFADDSKLIYPIDRDTLAIRDFLVKNSLDTPPSDKIDAIKFKRNVKLFNCDKDGRYLVVLLENNEMVYIDLETKKYLGTMPSMPNGTITDLKINNAGTELLVGNVKGEIFHLKLQDYLELRDDTQFEFTNEKEKAAKPKKKAPEPNKKEPQKKETKRPKKVINGQSLDFRINYILQDQTYQNGINFDLAYLNCNLPVKNLYVGGLVGFCFSVPTDKYKYSYYSGSVQLQNPYLINIDVAVPVGMYFYPFKHPDFFLREEVDIGVSYITLWNGNLGANQIVSKGGMTFDVGDTVSFGWRFLELNAYFRLNTAIGPSFKVGVGFNKILNIKVSQKTKKK